MTADRRWGRKLPTPTDPLFVYGTLQFPEVLDGLLGRTPHLEPAVLPGRRVAALPGRVYPGLVTASDTVAQGFLLSGLTAAEWRILDDFEDDEYDLSPVSVHAADREVYAWTYAWTAEVDPRDWSALTFRADHLAAYADRLRPAAPDTSPVVP
ncbi:gamma-glutamylcyclotransferase family protein [Nocardia huaxiensis]|uniref:Putative gamma-glutamylcyclotransferase n=1 Tax=Nocardia huaxiensis TaxID=2755382 RepID=A0A7D6ZMZ0_9NOCA|nr:gamma-glutamylcyclotransferase family protein [Nocardia huaxiensis]QLY29485.1 gamma-glutamylcyclotransferase [Nocardia huaxiensis]UFS96960.1 gamma-glutamylcyclotransferase [Nocardia huaxiensis]